MCTASLALSYQAQKHITFVVLPKDIAEMLQMRKRKRTRTSQYRGVTRAGAKWRAAIRINNIKRELGVFDTEAEAARYAFRVCMHPLS